MNTTHLTPWKTVFERIDAARAAARRVLLARREKDALLFGTTAASIKGTRNLLYLAAKGVIPAPAQSARVAQEVTAANIAKAQRAELSRTVARAMGA